MTELDAAQMSESCGYEWTDGLGASRCDLPKNHTSGAHSQRLTHECPLCGDKHFGPQTPDPTEGGTK